MPLKLRALHVRIASQCPLCNRELVLRIAKTTDTPFLGCPGFPECKFTEPYSVALTELARELRAVKSELHQVEKHLAADN